jgi:hypothetical protein
MDIEEQKDGRTAHVLVFLCAAYEKNKQYPRYSNMNVYAMLLPHKPHILLCIL